MLGGIIFAAALSAIAGWCVARQFAPERPRPIPPSYDLTPWGEVIEFPVEMRTAARMGQRGGAAEQRQPSDSQTQTLAHGTSLTHSESRDRNGADHAEGGVMRIIGSPGYVRTYRSDELRDRLSDLHRKRWGAPEGFCTVYGIHVPFEHREPVRYWSDWLVYHAGEGAAHDFINDLKANGWSGVQRIRELMDEKKQIHRNRETIRNVEMEARRANQDCG